MRRRFAAVLENPNRESTGEMFVTRSHSDILNMADNCEYVGRVAHFPKLEDLCVQFIRVNVKYWKPEQFLGKIS